MGHQLRARQLRRAVGEERGSVLVVFAVAIPTFVVLAAIVLDIGNWYMHKRQLQNRVDAGALAAGLAYGYSFPACAAPGDGTDADKIAAVAKQFTGVENPSSPPAQFYVAADAPAYNSMAQTQSELGVTINSSTYAGPNQYGTDYTDDQPANQQSASSHLGTPCYDHNGAGYWTDVKAKETSIPSLFGNFGIAPTITANARVAVTQMTGATDLRPFAIADPLYTGCAWVTGGGQTVPLSGGPTHWTYNLAAFSLPSNAPPVHGLWLSVTLGEKPANGCPASPSAQSVTYPNVGYIAGWEQPLSGPTLSNFSLTGSPIVPADPLGCGVVVPRDGSDCTSFKVSATVDFTYEGGTECNPADPPTVIAQIQPAGAPVQTLSLTPNADPCTGGDMWTGTAAMTPGEGNGGDGTVRVWLDTHKKPYVVDTNGNLVAQPPQDRTLGDSSNPLGSVMAGDDRQEGPIEKLTLSPQVFWPAAAGGDPVPTTVDLTLDPLQTTSPTTPTLIRGSDGGTNTLSGPIGCDPKTVGDDPAVVGCAGPFSVQCNPASALNDPALVGCASPLANNLILDSTLCTTQKTCVTVTNPDSPGHAFSCTPDNWPPTAQVPTVADIPRGDPRLITVALTPVGSAFAEGDQHAIAEFAAFYVTGWDGGGSCAVNELKPSAQTTYDEPGAQSSIWGHFVKFVQPPSAGIPSPDPCDPQTATNGVSACIATLVR